jgi:hypothetical protein
MGHAMFRSLAVVIALLGSLVVPASAQQPLRSECLAMANAPPPAMPINLRRVAAKRRTSPSSAIPLLYRHARRRADRNHFNGVYRTGRLPDVVTMNRAHSTHYTLFPDPNSARPAAGAKTDSRRWSRRASATSLSAT